MFFFSFSGITEKLDYIQDLGVDTVWIQPFFKSPMDDMGYDVQDFKAVDPLFGTMEDFKRLLKGIKERGKKLWHWAKNFNNRGLIKRAETIPALFEIDEL